MTRRQFVALAVAGGLSRGQVRGVLAQGRAGAATNPARLDVEHLSLVGRTAERLVDGTRTGFA